MASCPPPQLRSARMLLAKHRQLQPVNCLIAHQSTSPNKERWRSGTKVVERMGRTQRGVRINERATIGSHLSSTHVSPPGSTSTRRVNLTSKRMHFRQCVWGEGLFYPINLEMREESRAEAKSRRVEGKKAGKV
ncbi:hypothetical protein EYF80_031246 [Liparis tanakae]|uniref:Uncharacterized protein n=1 Tax=Liparis tanakae TaxID=230148 RepID=A0A4Z2H110_9TELE|nr:hypothetical protein EYF80_031246 [Liparis tanakae]